MNIPMKKLRSLQFVCATVLALAAAGGLPALLLAAEPQKPVSGSDQPLSPERKPETAQPKARMANPADRAPVSGALISVELQPKAVRPGQPTVVVSSKPTDAKGMLQFKIPEAGACRVTVDLSKTRNTSPVRNLQVFVTISDGAKGPITFGSKTGKNPLLFETPTFDLGDSTRTYTLTITSSPADNNYGINDEGIK